MEKIGQVLLDDTLYPGKDLYTDAATGKVKRLFP